MAGLSEEICRLQRRRLVEQVSGLCIELGENYAITPCCLTLIHGDISARDEGLCGFSLLVLGRTQRTGYLQILVDDLRPRT